MIYMAANTLRRSKTVLRVPRGNVTDEHIFRRYRRIFRKTQEELAELLDIRRQGHVSHYEIGRRPVPLDIAYRFVALARKKGWKVLLEDIYPPRPPVPRKPWVPRKPKEEATTDAST
jgi:DNA-binding XRE family transcriptional regulator